MRKRTDEECNYVIISAAEQNLFFLFFEKSKELNEPRNAIHMKD